VLGIALLITAILVAIAVVSFAVRFEDPREERELDRFIRGIDGHPIEPLDSSPRFPESTPLPPDPSGPAGCGASRSGRLT
jgi:hypothetical protein